jgi:hypothetical protein
VAGIAVTIAALTVLAMSAGPEEPMTASTGLRLGFCAAALATVLIGWGATKVATPGVVAGLAGLAFGGSALCSRALTVPPQPMEHPGAAALAIVTEPLTGALVVFAATGMLLYTSALQRGQVGPVTAVLWIGEVIAPSAVALALLGDTVRPGWSMAATVAGLVTVGAAVLLSTAPATSATARPAESLAIEAPKRPIPIAAPPSRDRYAGKMLWWGQPPIWRPVDRTTAALAAAPVAELTWEPPLRTRPAWAAPQPSDADRIDLPVPAQPAEPSRHAGTFLWSEEPPIWRPSDRTNAR